MSQNSKKDVIIDPEMGEIPLIDDDAAEDESKEIERKVRERIADQHRAEKQPKQPPREL